MKIFVFESLSSNLIHIKGLFFRDFFRFQAENLLLLNWSSSIKLNFALMRILNIYI